MNKSAIQKFAIQARRDLIEQVKQRAYQYGVEQDGYGDADADAVSGRVLTPVEKSQRQELIRLIQDKGYDQVMEEVAYTWFNRFIALRFMEVNNYLPTHIRVFSDASGAFKPEILSDVLHLELEGLSRERVSEYLEQNDDEGLYRYLLLTQCNALSACLPRMFEPMGSYTELLLPNNILRPDSVLGHMVSDIPEEDWQDAVQIIGWMYQYYNTELKDDTFAKLKKNIKITKERIPAATQLFTPDWIVRYMVENSLGRIFINSRIASAAGNDQWTEAQRIEQEKELAAQMGWKYYLPEAEQTPEVRAQLRSGQCLVVSGQSLTELKVIDPCMGSGHILVYAFDVLMQIYTASGWDQREAAQSILKNNLFGLDIDDRAAQLAYFAVMMKARQYDRRLFRRGIQPNVMAIRASNGIPDMAISYFHQGDPKRKEPIRRIVQELQDAKEYGSILEVQPEDWTALYQRFDEIFDDIDMMRKVALEELLPLVTCAEWMAQKYDVVVTNPPYMAVSNAGAKVNDYVKKNYPDSKADLFAVFIERCGQMAKKNGYQAMITQPSFLFLTSFECLRNKVITTCTIGNLLHMGRGIFGVDFGSVAFVFKNCYIHSYKSVYFRLHERTFQYVDPDDIEALYIRAKNDHSFEYSFTHYDTAIGVVNQPTSIGKKRIYYESFQDNFSKIPGSPVAYWVSEHLFNNFKVQNQLSRYGTQKSRVCTGNNDLFLRMWFEINKQFFKYPNKWIPYPKGGQFRKWYGNFEYVINYENGGELLYSFKGATPGNKEFHLQEGITWSALSSGAPSFRIVPPGCICDQKGPLLFIYERSNLYYLIGILNSKVSKSYLNIISPTLDYIWGSIAKVPIILDEIQKEKISNISVNSIDNSIDDWDSYETSWDFKRNPLV